MVRAPVEFRTSNRFRARAAAVAAIATLSMIASPGPAPAASLVEVTSFGSNPGNLKMFKYVPTGLGSSKPLVVLLHGCTQTAASYDDESGWVKYADAWQFALVIAQQQSSNNSSSCFNWFESGDYARGAGEALSVKQMTDKMKTDHGSDASRIFVSGLSSGGAMAAVMMAAYPDVFAGGSIVAGVPYKCATGVSAGFSCMNPGVDKTPQQWGDLVRGAYAGYGGPYPKVSIWHGTSDTTVQPVNATESMEQWTNVHGTDQTPDVEDTVKGYPHKVYRNAGGVAVVETTLITGMGHGTPLDPGAAADQCGTAGAFMLDVNICSTYFTARFFGLDNSDTQAPAVSITSPTGGAVSGSVTISASASDNVGVTKVEFLVDGALLDTDTAAPFSTAWDTAAASNGTHTLLARAYDAAGNSAASQQVTVTVTGGIEDVTAPSVNITFPANGSTVSGTITVSASASDDVGVAEVEFFVDGASIGNGVPAGSAGPWTISWNTTAVSNGSHALMAKAYDAKGNVGTDNDTTVTVNQAVAVLDETFSNRDGNGDYFDNGGWTAGGYVSSTENHTAAAGNSAFGYASSGTGCATGNKTKTLSRSVALPNNPVLSYWRKLDLKALINTSTTASFTVKVNTTVVDQKAVTYANYAETSWTERANLSLSSFAGQTVTLAFEAAANSNVCMEAWGKAWLDDIRIGNAQQAPDATAPTINVTAPSGGATVSGSVDITATASDNVGVAKVEFYVDGMLLGIDTAAPYALTFDTTTVPNGTHSLMAKAVDAAGNVGVDDDTAITVSNGGGGSVSASFSNADANDGYVKANADGSSAALGTLESTYGLAVGRGSDAKYNRTVLSFDTSSIPDGATVTRAYITVTLNSSYADPWASPAGNTLVIDVKTGCFGSGCAIETGDWGSSPSQSAVSTVPKWTSGSTSSSNFSSAGLGAISKTGTTQLKLRFSSNQTSTAYIFIGRGAAATLHVEYT